jgi:son of sevenless-like protein
LFQLLKPESKTKFDQIASLLDSGSNFERYRSAINQAVVPAVPYIGLYLSDLTFIEDGNPAVLGPNNLLNFDKRYLLAKVIGEIQRLQSGKYIYRFVVFSADISKYWRLIIITLCSIVDQSLRFKPICSI